MLQQLQRKYLVVDSIAFQAKVDHPWMCVISKVYLTFIAHVTLTFTQWPWYTSWS